MRNIRWYRSLYWRIAIGFIAFLTALLAVQAVLFLWLAGRTTGAFPATSAPRLAALIASDVAAEMERSPEFNLADFIDREYAQVAQPFVVVMIDGRVVGSRGIPLSLVRAARTRLERMERMERIGRRGRTLPRERGAGDRRPEFAPILAGGEVVGIVAVTAGRTPLATVVRELGPTMALAGLTLLVTGTALAAVIIFGPVRRRLADLQQAAQQFGAGQEAARAPEQGGDEVAALARAFNRMADDLVARSRQVEASDRARRQLLADVSHELMTPLTAMRGYLETLSMREVHIDAESRDRYVRIIEEETRRLERIIGDLLDLARLEGGGGAIRRERVSTAALFERVAERHGREVEQRNIRLTSTVGPGAEELDGDPDRLEQALQNLAANALRHTPDGGEISLTATSAGPRHLTITLRDTGPGIPAEHLPLIFDRFYKVDSARRATGGSGLGLSIVKAIVERHGGTVAARNDGGAVFEVTLPVMSLATPNAS
jgi:two-component system OmpR family sensor kinase